MSKKLEGKIALVTGASKGIGAAIAKHLAAAGARVVVNYASSKADGEKVVAEITKAGGQAVAVQADVAKKADIVRLLGEVKKAHGKLDILVNNAGIFSPGAPLGQITEEHFHRLFDLNVLGVILVTQEALPLMGAGGSIINTSSVVSTLSPPGNPVYNASKAAVDCLTRTFARELGPKNIRVNSVNPGLVETEGVNSAPHLKDRKDEVAKMNMLGRIGQPDDIAPIVVYLASDEASWTTGESFYVSGGMH
jgi:3-oxoacyl-[acyl-carrier protein] reductase